MKGDPKLNAKARDELLLPAFSDFKAVCNTCNIGNIFLHIYAPASLLPLPPGHGHGLPPAPPVDLWCVWIGVNVG